MKKSFFFVVLSITLTSCATIMSGAKQNVKISSSPSQATVIVDSLEIGKTPLKTKLKRKQNHIVRLELEGYQPYEIELKRKFNAWIIGNRSEEHTSELQSRENLVCRLLLEKKNENEISIQKNMNVIYRMEQPQ